MDLVKLCTVQGRNSDIDERDVMGESITALGQRHHHLLNHNKVCWYALSRRVAKQANDRPIAGRARGGEALAFLPIHIVEPQDCGERRTKTLLSDK
jgi:hypothetical protein